MNVQISSRRQFLRTIALAGFGLAAAACVPVPEISTDSAAPGEEPVGLSLWGWWDTRMTHYRSVADQFAEHNGRITVDVDSTAGGDPEKSLLCFGIWHRAKHAQNARPLDHAPNA